jgi:hypothetical protein
VNIFGTSSRDVTARRRKWGLFFERKRLAGRRQIRMVKSLFLWLRYSAEVVVNAVRGRAWTLMLNYLVGLSAWVKASLAHKILLEFRAVLDLYKVKSAGLMLVKHFYTYLNYGISKRTAVSPTNVYGLPSPQVLTLKGHRSKPYLSYMSYDPQVVIQKIVKEITVKFCSYDNYPRDIIVCVDKLWGEPGCQPWTGDWYAIHASGGEGGRGCIPLPPPFLCGPCVTSPSFTFSRVLTAVTSSDAGYYYTVEFLDRYNNVIKRCNFVDRRNPCYLYISEVRPNA